MKKFLILISAIFLMFSCTEEKPENEILEILVGFKKEVSELRAQEIIDDNLLMKISKIKGLNIYKVKPKTATDLKKLTEKLVAYPEVKYAEPNYTVEAL